MVSNILRGKTHFAFGSESSPLHGLPENWGEDDKFVAWEQLILLSLGCWKMAGPITLIKAPSVDQIFFKLMNVP